MPRRVSPAASSAAPARKPALKSPLRTATMSPVFPGDPRLPASEVALPAPVVTAQQLRLMQVSEFAAWLRTQTSPKTKRPFAEQTVVGYSEAARALDRWMEAQEIDGDFTACDVPMLNRFFAEYHAEHNQGGTNNRQRNLHHLFKWLAKSYGHPDPWASDELVRYGPVKSRPSTLAEDFIRDLLAVTGDGKARSFIDVRDHAIIRMLTEGVRRTELADIQIGDLAEDLVARPFVRVVPLKGAREFTQGRLVPLMMSTASALAAYLRVRRTHAKAALPALWLGSSNRGPMTGAGIYQMLERRAEQAGYDPRAVHPHMFRHTFANDWLAGGGSEGDLMRLMGWKDRSMVDRYAADMQEQRAFEAKRRRGDLY
jgi:site-specific recombinase XerD